MIRISVAAVYLTLSSAAHRSTDVWKLRILCRMIHGNTSVKRIFHNYIHFDIMVSIIAES
jgi:hypothetical protein